MQPRSITFAQRMAAFCESMRARKLFEAGVTLGMAAGIYKRDDDEYERAQELVLAAHEAARLLMAEYLVIADWTPGSTAPATSWLWRRR